MTPCKRQIVRVCLFLLAAAPVYAQRGNIGIDVGEISDRFGSLQRFTDPSGDVNGQFIVLRGNAKEAAPNVVAGGEIRFPSDTTHHATEFAVYGGLEFHAGSAFSFGFHAQVRKILVPPSAVDGQVFNRNNFELLQLPPFLEYKFGPGKHAFVRAEGEPEFSPRFRVSSTGATPLPHPNFNYGYTVRGSVGYIFGNWYAKASYETRYFKFTPNLGNPGGLYNWRTDFATVGAGLIF
jgi:hypothetical protein